MATLYRRRNDRNGMGMVECIAKQRGIQFKPPLTNCAEKERVRVRAATFPIHFKSPLSEHNSITTEILSQSIKVAREEEGMGRPVSRLTPDEGDLGKKIFLFVYCVGVRVRLRCGYEKYILYIISTLVSSMI